MRGGGECVARRQGWGEAGLTCVGGELGRASVLNDLVKLCFPGYVWVNCRNHIPFENLGLKAKKQPGIRCPHLEPSCTLQPNPGSLLWRLFAAPVCVGAAKPPQHIILVATGIWQLWELPVAAAGSFQWKSREVTAHMPWLFLPLELGWCDRLKGSLLQASWVTGAAR